MINKNKKVNQINVIDAILEKWLRHFLRKRDIMQIIVMLILMKTENKYQKVIAIVIVIMMIIKKNIIDATEQGIMQIIVMQKHT